MKKIRIQFIDVWFKDYKASQVMSYIIDSLSKRYEIIITEDNPDCIICSCYGTKAVMYDRCKIFLSAENIIPDFNLYDYGIGCSHINFGRRYLRIPLYSCYKKEFVLALNKHKMEVPRDRKFCNMVISNGTNANSIRTDLFYELSKYKQVDSGGRYLNNVGGPVKDKLQFQKNYKFSFAMENSKLSGYVCEKIIQAWAAGSIPIYWGDPEIENEFDKDTFINCNEKSIDEIVNEIIEVDKDDELYKRMIKKPICTEDSHLLASSYLDESKILDFFNKIVDSGFERYTLKEGAAGGYLNRHKGYTKIYYSPIACFARNIKSRINNWEYANEVK